MAWRTGGHHFSLDLRLETGQKLSSWSPASKQSFGSACKGSLLPCDSGSFGSLEGLTGLNMSARNVRQCRDLQACWPAAGPLRTGFVPSILPAASWRLVSGAGRVGCKVCGERKTGLRLQVQAGRPLVILAGAPRLWLVRITQVNKELSVWGMLARRAELYHYASKTKTPAGWPVMVSLWKVSPWNTTLVVRAMQNS